MAAIPYDNLSVEMQNVEEGKARPYTNGANGGTHTPGGTPNPNTINQTHMYFKTEEKLHGFLSQQFPTIANPAPLGLGAFALTTFALSMCNAGAIVSKS
jgi:hypothetical protein